MIHPSYVDLMNVVNKGVEEGETPVINSRYSIVMATSKRARQIIGGDEPLVNAKESKPLSARALENSLTEEALRESEANVLGEAAEEQDVTEEDEEN